MSGAPSRKLSVGDYVEHFIKGPGKVLKITKTREGNAVLCQFSRTGERLTFYQRFLIVRDQEKKS